MKILQSIQQGKVSIGIEFGSTRIKAVLIGEDFSPLASGAHNWENRFENGVWTYSEKDIREGLQSCFKSLSEDVAEKYGVTLKTAASIGISAMMHGYLPFDKDDRLLVPFRTWRNTMTEEAAEKLSDAFDFNIPQRWSVAHLYGAILKDEPHVGKIRFLTTLAGYVHYLLTGERVIGTGDASGMFPIDPMTGSYNEKMLDIFNGLVKDKAYSWKLSELLPKVVPVGEAAGVLSESGALLLDPSGEFGAGVPLCPPEGDAGTGMVATDSIRPKTCNVSAGTSIFAMAVLEKDLSARHSEIDIVTTPCGSPVAMVHCNNCSTDLDAWVRLFGSVLESFGAKPSKAELYDKIYDIALSGDPDCGGVLSYNYYSGEHVTGLSAGMPLLMHSPEGSFTAGNLLRSLVCSTMATLKIGMDILFSEGVSLDKITAHGGLFKTPAATQKLLAAALGVPVSLMKSAGEGGAWGIAVLAAYIARESRAESLYDYLENKVFAGQQGETVCPNDTDRDGFEAYIARYKAKLAVEKTAVKQ